MIYTQVGIYKGRIFAVKKVKKKSIEITREMKKELKIVSFYETVEIKFFYENVVFSFRRCGI